MAKIGKIVQSATEKARHPRRGVTYNPPMNEFGEKVVFVPKDGKSGYAFDETTGGFTSVTLRSYKDKRRAKNRVARASRKANRR